MGSVTVQKAIPLLSNLSSIVFNASVSGSIGTPTTSVYSAAKAGLRLLARTFSAELAELGVRGNVVSPGPIETPGLDRIDGLPPEVVPSFKAQINESVPLKRFGTSEEVASAVLFLASSESSYILGAELFVDGGMTQL